MQKKQARNILPCNDLTNDRLVVGSRVSWKLRKTIYLICYLYAPRFTLLVRRYTSRYVTLERRIERKA